MLLPLGQRSAGSMALVTPPIAPASPLSCPVLEPVKQVKSSCGKVSQSQPHPL